LTPIREWLARGIVVALLVATIGLAIVFLFSEPPMPQDAREAVLRTNLETLREALASYDQDHGHGPDSLQTLILAGYVRKLPVDPMSGDSVTWDVVRADDGTIRDVHSASEETALDGSYYRNW